MSLVGEPSEQKASPTNIVDAQFSAPFVIATALATGKMEWDSYRCLNDPQVRALMQRISCENDPEIETMFPTNMSGKLTVRTKGHTYVRTVVVPKGEPDNFLTESDLREKFNALADSVLGRDGASRLADAILSLDRLNLAATLFEYGVGATHGAQPIEASDQPPNGRQAPNPNYKKSAT